MYGNCQLNIGPEDLVHLGPVLRLVIGEDVRSARMTSHFADIDGGAIGAVTDSYGMVALAVDRGSAAEVLRVGAGDGVYIYAGQADGATSAVSIRPATYGNGVRPATTLTVALLIGVIMASGIISLLMMK